jgi:hypothetical protein
VAVDSKAREQLNLSLTSDSPVAQKLHEAAELTGQPRSQIARAVLSDFLDVWLEAERARKSVVDAATTASRSERGAIVVRDLGHARPRYRGAEYQPAPDYWKAVEARRPLPPYILSRQTGVPTHAIVRRRPAPRSAEPARAVEADETAPDA